MTTHVSLLGNPIRTVVMPGVGPQGPAGPQGPIGPTGVQGPVGPGPSTGATSNPVFTDNGDGTASVTSALVNIFSTADFSGAMTTHTVPAATLGPFTDGAEEYISVRYNSGSPIYARETVGTSMNHSNVLPMFVVWRQGNTLHSLGFDCLGSGLPNKTQSAFYHTDKYRISDDGGLIASETATPAARTILVSAGLVYTGAIPQDVLSFNSSVDQFTLAYHSAPGVWSYVDQTQYNNTQYDTGSALATINSNKYAVRWIYRSIGDVRQVFYVLGTSGNYNSATDAALELPRTDLPILIQHHCKLVGRSIIKYNATSGLTQSIVPPLVLSEVINHNDTGNKQGGTDDQYYHMTAEEHTGTGTGAFARRVSPKFGSDTNYTTFESDGTKVAVGDATFWEDLVFPIIPKFTGTGNPTFNTFVGGITAPQFAVNDACQLDASEFFHKWKEGSTGSVHLHYISMTNVAAARTVKWEVGITYVPTTDGTSQWVNEIVFQIEHTIPANTPTLTEFIVPMGTIAPTGGKVGGQMRARVKRITASGTAPATNPFLTQVGVHLECDTDGSRQIASK